MEPLRLNLIIGAVIGILGMLLGVIAGNIFNQKSLQLQLEITQSFEDKRNRIRNLEELYSLISSLSIYSLKFSTIVTTLNKNELNSLPFDYFNELSNEIVSQLTRIEIKLRIYAPELLQDYSTLSEKVNDLINSGRSLSLHDGSVKDIVNCHQLVHLESRKLLTVIEQKIINSLS